jgi:hypothetical protein
MTTRDRVLNRLSGGEWLCIFEFNLAPHKGCSENSLGTRLPQYAKEGLVISRKRENCDYKEWHLPIIEEKEYPVELPEKWDGSQRVII